mmetsp:Transcript_44863/g.72056  ORF Transcript_44863/g.72056 Transcript_44863/m.72056 type:complete len:428 (+) Transcript_44863:146-1429(+)
MDSFPYLTATLLFSIAVCAFESYLDIRQYNLYFVEKRPKDLQSLISEKNFLRSQDYNADKMRFKLVSTLFFEIESTLSIVLFVYPFLWEGIPNWFGISEDSELLRSLAFQGILTMASKIVRLPFSLYSTFVLEERHGFKSEEMTLGLYFTDMGKEIILTCIIGAPLLCILITLINWGGERFYLYVWAFLMAFQFIMMYIYPNYIQPCFNKVETLPESNLKKAIEELASKKDIDFPLKELYQIDGSKRSSHSNAYMYGFCNNKRIVLYDTLIRQNTEPEIVAVLAHELGHWKLSHTLKNMFIGAAQMLAMLWLFSRFIGNQELYESFGFKEKKNATIIGLILFFYIYSPIAHVIGLLMTMWSRKCEFEADEFAVNLGYAPFLRSGLIKLQEENLGTMVPDWMYSAYHHSHPPLVQRLAAIDAAGKKAA